MASILNVDQIRNAAGTTAMTIDSSGNITASGRILTPTRPYFLAQAVHSDTSYTNQVVPFPNVIENDGSHYSTSDNAFTAPVTGLYLFSYSVNGYTTGADRVFIQRANDGTNYYNIDSRGATYANETSLQGLHTRGSENVSSYDMTVLTVPLKVDANGKVRLRINNGTVRLFHANFFSGYLIG